MPPPSRFDSNFNRQHGQVTPRNCQIFSSLLRHLHDFARQVELSNDEWMTGWTDIPCVLRTFTSWYVTHDDYKGCTTQLYPKDDLIIEFKPRENDHNATLDLEYNAILSPKGYKGKQFDNTVPTVML